jgi:hypothetical protein
LKSNQNGWPVAGASFGGKTFEGCIDDDAVDADSMFAGNGGTLDNTLLAIA